MKLILENWQKFVNEEIVEEAPTDSVRRWFSTRIKKITDPAKKLKKAEELLTIAQEAVKTKDISKIAPQIAKSGDQAKITGYLKGIEQLLKSQAPDGDPSSKTNLLRTAVAATENPKDKVAVIANVADEVAKKQKIPPQDAAKKTIAAVDPKAAKNQETIDATVAAMAGGQSPKQDPKLKQIAAAVQSISKTIKEPKGFTTYFLPRSSGKFSLIKSIMLITSEEDLNKISDYKVADMAQQKQFLNQGKYSKPFVVINFNMDEYSKEEVEKFEKQNVQEQYKEANGIYVISIDDFIKLTGNVKQFSNAAKILSLTTPPKTKTTNVTQKIADETEQDLEQQGVEVEEASPEQLSNAIEQNVEEEIPDATPQQKEKVTQQVKQKLSSDETKGGTDPEKIDPDPEKLEALQDSFVNFRDKFYTKKKLTEQAALVNDLLAKLKAFNDEESAEAFKRNPNRKKAAGKRDDLSENEETEIIAKSKDIRNFKASVRSFRRAMQKSKQLVSNAMTDTKKGKLVGYGSRKKVVEFATETQKRIKILNNSINLILGPAERGSLQEKFSPEVQKKVDKYQETLDLIEDVFEDIVGTDVSKGGIGNIIDKIVNKVDMEYSEIKIGVDNALKKLSTIKKYFPSIIPFQGSKIESTNIVSEYEAAIKNLNLSSSDIQTLNDALEGEQGKIAILNFQDRLIEFSGDIERIFGIAGLKEKDAAEPVKVQGDIDDTERKEKSGNYVVDEYGADEFFKDMKENVKQSFFKMLNLLHSKGLFKENISNMYKELEKTDSVKAVRIKAAISGLDEKDQSNIKTYLNNAGGGNKFIEFLKRTKFFETEVDDSGETTAADDEDDTEEKEELSLKNQTEIDQFFKAEFLNFTSQLRDLNDKFGGNFADNFKQLIMYYLWFKNSQQPKKDKTNENKEDQGPRLKQYARDALKDNFGLDKKVGEFETLLRLRARPMIEFMNKIYEKKSDTNRNKVITGFIDKLNNLNVKIGNLQLPTIAKLAGDKDSEKEKQKQAALDDLDEYLESFKYGFGKTPKAEKTIIKQILKMLIDRDLHIPEAPKQTESAQPIGENLWETSLRIQQQNKNQPYTNVVQKSVDAAFDSEVAPDIIDIFNTFFNKSNDFQTGRAKSNLIKAVIEFFTDNKNKFKDVLKKEFFRRAASEIGRIGKGLVNKAKRATKKTQQEQLEIALRPLIEKLMRGE